MVVATAIALLALDAAGFGPIRSLRRTVVTVGEPVGLALAVVASPVVGAWHGAVHYDDVLEENRQLRHRNAELAGRLAAQPDTAAELASVLAATEIDFLGDVERVTARVVADRRTPIERTIEIDKGADHGIGEGMPVVTGLGLVGAVELVTDRRSVIRLITDVEAAIGIRSTGGLGVARGAGIGVLEVTATPELSAAIGAGDVTDGARLLTSGVDRSLYPAGIPVGTLQADPGSRTRVDGGIAATDEDGAPIPAGPTRTPVLQLRPLADLDRLGYVTVLLTSAVGP
ncbi:MAG: rod shape-determining protein MreC [Actinomycetota bacterium]